MRGRKKVPVKDNSELTLSPSSINTFYSSKYKWWLIYREGFSIDASIHLVKGSAVHYALETVFENKIWVGDNYKESLFSKAMNAFEKEWTKDKLDILELEQDELEKHRNDAINMIEMFVENLSRQIRNILISGHASSAGHALNLLKPVFREAYLKDTELNIGGYLDCIMIDKQTGSVTIIDYKTSNKFKGKMSEEYSRQLGIYAYLYLVNNGKAPEWVGINYLRFGETFYIHVDERLIAWAREEIEKVRTFINTHNEKEHYLPNETDVMEDGRIKENSGFYFIPDYERKLILSPYGKKKK